MDKIWILTVTRESDSEGLVINTYPYLNLEDAQNDMNVLSKKLINKENFNVIDEDRFLIELERGNYEDYYLIQLTYKKIEKQSRGLEMIKEKFNTDKFIGWYNTINFKKDLGNIIPVTNKKIYNKIKLNVYIDTEDRGYEIMECNINDNIINYILKNINDISGDIYCIKMDFVFDDDMFEYEKYPSCVEGYVYEGLFNEGKTIMKLCV